MKSEIALDLYIENVSQWIEDLSRIYQALILDR